MKTPFLSNCTPPHTETINVNQYGVFCLMVLFPMPPSCALIIREYPKITTPCLQRFAHRRCYRRYCQLSENHPAPLIALKSATFGTPPHDSAGAPTLRRFFCWRKTPSLWAIVGWNGNATPAISAPDWPPCGWVSPLRAFFANARLVKGKTATRLGLPSLTATGRPYGIISAAGWRQKTARFRWPRPTARWLLGLYRRTILGRYKRYGISAI